MPEIKERDPRILRSQPYRDQIRAEIQARIASYSCKPGLMIEQPNNDAGSNSYVPVKMREASVVNINAYRAHFPNPDKTTPGMVIDFIKYANTLPNIHANIVQRPSHEQLKPFDDEILSHIIPIQDVDGLRPDSPHTPATASGIMELLKRSGRLKKAKDEGGKAVVWGKGPLSGGPTAKLLRHEGFDVHVIDSKSTEEEKIKYTKQGNLIVLAVGRGPRLVTAKYFVEGQNATVVDVGVNRDVVANRNFGDADAESVLAILGPEGALTPVIGGVGPMTVEMLLVNVVNSYDLKPNRTQEQAA